MSSITETPNTYDFGYAFNYEMWNENTVLTLVNVPWNNDYRDIVRFATSTARDSWIDSQEKVTIPNVSLQKFSQNVRIDLPVNAALRFNYLRASNPVMPVQGDVQRNYYYFVTGVNYLSPDTTELMLQLDVWQTFGYEVSFGSCYVERGHIGIANSNAFDNFGRDYLLESEGLDIGSEYRTVHVESENIIDEGFSVLIASITDLAADPGDTDNPHLSTASGTVIQGMPSGAAFWYFDTVEDSIAYFAARKDNPWITQGILSVTAIPKITRYYPDYPVTGIPSGGVQLRLPPNFAAPKRSNNMKAAWRNSSFINDVLGSRYSMLKKFLTYPYMLVELTTFTGSPLVIKPEMWQSTDAVIDELISIVPPGQRVVFSVSKYNADSETSGDTTSFDNDDYGEFLDMSTALDNFPTFPVVNDMAINFLASNKNGLHFQFTSADWSQQRALRGAQVERGQAQQQMAMDSRLTRIQQGSGTQAAMLQSGLTMGHAIVSGGAAVGGGALAGAQMGAGGAIAGTAGGAMQAAVGGMQASIDMVGQQAANAIRNTALGAANAARIGTGQYIADTNLQMSQYAAKGDYQNTIAGVNAKIQDARMTQPSTAGQFGGDAFNMINGVFGFSLRWKMLNKQAMKTIGDYWLRYGYAINQFVSIPTNLQCMTKFTYWKLSETYISQGKFPEAFRQIIRGIFEKGVTVWTAPEDIGNIDWADNAPIGGISY